MGLRLSVKGVTRCGVMHTANARINSGSRTAGQRSMAKVVPLSGGVPIKVGEETIGAVGVSGSTTAQDEICASSGLAAVADQLK